ncbi:glycine zipper domain-containing protein [Chitinophagaceae bacterium LB-8]|uniref:Glycine zipper domain-containing protein n=1 Tax=Paraflavisolibacter caeni TaxID=2982496 RepID=A0A9X3BES5_9BACT|nr:glycine zipper domain-containing protein [Paraflavisolibacter caeni]MCU7547569.1 glycine zipper domain-containing protein [Paraflavisolibacter caeni]
MKQILAALSIAVVMTACSNNPSTDTTKSVSTVDTAGLAEFQAFKQQAAMMKMYEMQNMNAGLVAPQASTAAYSSAPVRRTSSRSYSSRSNGYQSGSMSSSSGNTAKARRGWSKAAKGAVIGGATGAVAGAVINKKNRAVGAVIGGVLGAGGGYAIGRGMDKRDGRF